jgi:hypothetical protein
MEETIKFYLLKLIIPRLSFSDDMTVEEKEIMQKHSIYWNDLMNKGFVVVYGPVMDPEGIYGLGVVKVTDKEQVETLIKNDPASVLGKYEVLPMNAILPKR